MTSEPAGTPWNWSILSPEEFTAAATYFNNRPRPRPVRTLTFKLHNPSKRRTRLLLEAHAFVTNASAELYDMWREDPAHPRQDGAVTAILSTATGNVAKPFSARKLDQLLEHSGKEQVTTLQGFHGSALCHGLYRQCSETLVSWFQHQRAQIPSLSKKEYDIEQFYDIWHHIERTYQQAMSIIASLSLPVNQRRPQSFTMLQRRSKREARWLLARLQPLHKLQSMQQVLQAYLDTEPSSLQRQALITDHLWKTEAKKRSRVREGWWWRRTFEASDNKRVIGELSLGEIELFSREVQEMIAHLEHIDSLIESYPELVRDTVLHGCQTPDQRLKHILTIFLQRKPHAYPQIERVQLIDDPDHPGTYRVLSQKAGTRELPEALYERRMSWFQVDKNHRRSLDQILSEQREAEEVQGMFAALRLLKPPKLQPLRFDGHARPRCI
ncbi:hypothetical protein H0W32_02880, partial [Patescibacteria group bacterium]|nr:hypothetical protein [Patescibacteria group bacterium]